MTINPYLLGVICLLGGGYFVVRHLILLRSPEALNRFLDTNPKAFRLVRKVGRVRAAEDLRKIYLPLGAIVGAVLFGLGVWLLISLFSERAF